MSSRPPAARSFPNDQIDEIRTAGSARPAALRRRLRSARSVHARISAADLPHHASGTGRRVPRAAADDQQLLRADGRHPHAGADRRAAPAADALPAGGVQSDRGPQERRPEPGRDLPRLPRQLPHQRGLPPDARHPPAGGALPARHHQPARHVQPADPRLEAVAAVGRGLHRVRAAHRLLQRRPRQRAAQGRAIDPTASIRSR